MESDRYWIWLSQLNISPKARTAVIAHFGGAEQAFRSPKGSFSGRSGISDRESEALEQRDLSETDRILAECRRQKLAVLPVTAPDYPASLRQIWCPPVVLYVQGTLPRLEEFPVLAVIGTRRASPYGIRMGRELASQLSASGALVLSLLTAGVDEAAAQGAVETGTPCIGVLGTSHEACRLPIAREVAACGAVVSEYPPGCKSQKHFFRERNRIAAGLSDGVVVVEAPEKSGTRLFVMDAVEQGKDIFAVPGNADAENAAGTLLLIKEGAKLITNAGDVLEEYRTRYPALPGQTSSRRPSPVKARRESADQPVNREEDAGIRPGGRKTDTADLSDDQTRILGSIDEHGTHVDDITVRTGLPMARVLSQLTLLEIRGFVRRDAGRRFFRIT